MAEQKVRTSTRLWSAEVALANSLGTIDAIGPGSEGAAAIAKPKREDYRFSSGRTFENKEYAPFPAEEPTWLPD